MNTSDFPFQCGTAGFGQWMRMGRARLQLTQSELAHLVGCKPTLVSLLENAKKGPSTEQSSPVIQNLIALLKMTAEEVLEMRKNIMKYRDNPDMLQTLIPAWATKACGGLKRVDKWACLSTASNVLAPLDQFVAEFQADGEFPAYPVADWHAALIDDKSLRTGYWAWAYAQLTAEYSEAVA